MEEAERSVAPASGLALAGSFTVAVWVALAWRSHGGGAPLGWMLATMAMAWAALAWAMRRAALREAQTILAFGVIFRLVALGAQPVMEDDHYRFLWDGYRFAATGDPYAEAPREHFTDATIPVEFRAVLDRINHPDVPTIYGPLTQWVFRLCYLIAPAQLWPLKLVLLGAELTILALLWPGLGARSRLLLAWCPLAIFETGFNAHPDALAISLLVTAWWLGWRGRFVAAGAVAGLAIAAKIFALPLVPFVLWRLGRRAWVVAAAVVVALYAPFWLRGRAADFAGLRAMAAEWEFNSSIYAVAAALSSPAAAGVMCGLAFGAIWLVLLARWRTASASSSLSSSPGRSLPPGEWVYGWFLLLSAVANPWYALWLWPFVAARISATGLCALAAVSLAYVTGLNLGDTSPGNFGHPWWLRPAEFGVIGVAAAGDWLKRKSVRGPQGIEPTKALDTERIEAKPEGTEKGGKKSDLRV